MPIREILSKIGRFLQNREISQVTCMSVYECGVYKGIHFKDMLSL